MHGMLLLPRLRMASPGMRTTSPLAWVLVPGLWRMKAEVVVLLRMMFEHEVRFSIKFVSKAV